MKTSWLYWLAGVFLVISFGVLATARQWTNTAGKSVEAELVEVDEQTGTVVLQTPKGKKMTGSMESLSEADREFIAAQQKEKTAKNVPVEKKTEAVETKTKVVEESSTMTQLHAKAEQGDVESQYQLGAAYVAGEGVAKDYNEAIKWWRKAAEQGHAKSQSLLGFAYATGEGVTKDGKEAVKWLRKAAEQGHADAKNQLVIVEKTTTRADSPLAQLRKTAEQQEIGNEMSHAGKEQLILTLAAIDHSDRMTEILLVSDDYQKLHDVLTKNKEDAEKLLFYARLKKYDDSLCQLYQEIITYQKDWLLYVETLNQLRTQDYSQELNCRIGASAQQAGEVGAGLGRATGGNNNDAAGMAILFGMVGGAASAEEHKKAILAEIQQETDRLQNDINTKVKKMKEKTNIFVDTIRTTYGWSKYEMGIRELFSEGETIDNTKMDKTQSEINPFYRAKKLRESFGSANTTEEKQKEAIIQCVKILPDGVSFEPCRQRIKKIITSELWWDSAI